MIVSWYSSPGGVWLAATVCVRRLRGEMAAAGSWCAHIARGLALAEEGSPLRRLQQQDPAQLRVEAEDLVLCPHLPVPDAVDVRRVAVLRHVRSEDRRAVSAAVGLARRADGLPLPAQRG